MRLNAPAVIHVAGQVRPAAFAWQTATGIAWLEPDYLEPDPPPRPAFHAFAGEVRDHAGGAAVYGDGIVLVFDAEAAAGDPGLVPADAAAGLAHLQELLAEAGTTWADERARVAELLAEDLAALGGVVA